MGENIRTILMTELFLLSHGIQKEMAYSKSAHYKELSTRILHQIKIFFENEEK